MRDAFIIDGIRTPIGKFGGSLSQVRADDLAAFIIRKISARNPEINMKRIDDVIFPSFHLPCLPSYSCSIDQAAKYKPQIPVA